MRKIYPILEKGNDSEFSIYIEDDLGYGIFGEGKTIDEAILDFKQSYEEIKSFYNEKGKYFEEVEFVFKY